MQGIERILGYFEVLKGDVTPARSRQAVWLTCPMAALAAAALVNLCVSCRHST